MKIPEFPELSPRQFETIMTIICIIGMIAFVLTAMYQNVSSHKFYETHRADCLAHHGVWNERMEKWEKFTWSCTYPHK